MSHTRQGRKIRILECCWELRSTFLSYCEQGRGRSVKVYDGKNAQEITCGEYFSRFAFSQAFKGECFAQRPALLLWGCDYSGTSQITAPRCPLCSLPSKICPHLSILGRMAINLCIFSSKITQLSMLKQKTSTFSVMCVINIP